MSTRERFFTALRILRGKEDQQTGVFVGGGHKLTSVSGPADRPPLEPPAPRVDKATGIGSLGTDDMAALGTLSPNERRRRDEIIQKIRDRNPLSPMEWKELERLCLRA